MNDALNTIHFSMNQDQLKMQSIMQNISNINTPAYKRQLSQTVPFEKILRPEKESLLHGTEQHPLFTQGTLKETGNSAHLALTDNHFFEIKNDSGIFYTRRGDFTVNVHGELSMATGGLLSGQNGSIRVEDSTFTINAQGEVYMNNQKKDQIQILGFAHPENLEYVGDGLFKANESPVSAPAGHHVLQGYLENSNVKSVEEMADLMQTARHFETSQRILRLADTMTATAISQLGENHV